MNINGDNIPYNPYWDSERDMLNDYALYLYEKEKEKERKENENK